jgi:hypothetical protein
MVVLMTLDLPVGREDLEAVSSAMGVRDDPPDGLIAHVMTPTADGVHVVDIWESRDHFQQFNDARLGPTLQKVLGERGVALEGPPPEPTFDDAFDLVRGR